MSWTFSIDGHTEGSEDQVADMEGSILNECQRFTDELKQRFGESLVKDATFTGMSTGDKKLHRS